MPSPRLQRDCCTQITASLPQTSLPASHTRTALPHPLSVYVDAFGSGIGGKTNEDLLKIVNENFDMRAGMLVRELDMLKPKYQKTAAYGHFGNSARPADPDFTWEIPKELKV